MCACAMAQKRTGVRADGSPPEAAAAGAVFRRCMGLPPDASLVFQSGGAPIVRPLEGPDCAHSAVRLTGRGWN